MSQILLKDIEQSLYERLEHSARESGITIEQQVVRLLQTHLPESNSKKKKALQNLRKIREETAHLQKTDCVDLLREDRDR